MASIVEHQLNELTLKQTFRRAAEASVSFLAF